MTINHLITIPPLPPSALLSKPSSDNRDVYKNIHTKPMPLVGYGTSNRSQSEIYNAIKAGARHLDCASLYGNESLVGRALTQFITENPAISRSHFFITTKVWCEDYEPDDMYNSVRKSLDRLNVEYVDCVLLHWPFVMKKYHPFVRHSSLTIEDVWKYSMEPLLISYKLTNYIGVSNFDREQLSCLLKSKIPPCVNQIECHLNFGQRDLVNFCHENGIHVVAWAPLNKGKIKLKRKIKAEVALKWLLQRGIGVIPSSRNKEHVGENMEVWKPMLNVMHYEDLYGNNDKISTNDFTGQSQLNKEDSSLVDLSQIFMKNVSFIGPIQHYSSPDIETTTYYLNQELMIFFCSRAEPGMRMFPDFIGIWPSSASYTSRVTGKVLHVFMSLLCDFLIIIGYPINLTDLSSKRTMAKERYSK